MKSSYIKRFLSAAMSLVLLVGAVPVLPASAESTDARTVSYSTLADKSKLALCDYTELGMHDGAGLNISDGGLVPDGDWWWQLNTVDTAITEKTGAYAVYDVLGGSRFTAEFSSISAPGRMSFYVSEDMVEWQSVKADISWKKASVQLPQNSAFIKLVWHSGKDNGDKLVSVEMTERAADSGFKSFNYGVNTPESSALQNGSTQEQSLRLNGVWESKGLARSSVLSPNFSELQAATGKNSYNGYATYKVKPNTRFGLTVTTLRTKTNNGTATNDTDNVAKALGYENPLDWNVEIYISSDNINFKKFDAVNAAYGARYANNQSGGNARRSTDYSFIVPDGVLYVRCRFPITQSLATVTDSSGASVWGYPGNDFFSINRVEFTEPDFGSEYTYWSGLSESKFIKSDLSAQSLSDFGMAAVNGIVYGNSVKDSKGLDVDFYFLWNGYNGAYAEYDIEKGTDFYAGIKIQYLAGLVGYLKKKPEYKVILQGYSEDGTWSDVKTLCFDSTYDGTETDYFLYMSGKENRYNRVRIYWPNFYSGDEYYVGNNLACITYVGLTHLDTSALVEGDFNSDGRFDISDLVRYKKILAGIEKEGIYRADINHSGKSDSADLTILKKYILGITVDMKDYSFDGKISLDVLNNYLDRAVSYAFDVKNYSAEDFEEGIRFITNVGAKYIQRAAGEWIPDISAEANYNAVAAQIEKAHTIDPDIIFEAAIFETSGGNVQAFTIPKDTAKLFGASSRGGCKFWEGNMAFDVDDPIENQGFGYWGGGCHLPDITKTETQMFVYYKACKYIDMGFEALHLGQTGLTGLTDTENAAWEKVIGLIRQYAAANARRHYVLINSHDTPDFVGSDAAKLVDFTMAPCRVTAAVEEVNHEVSENSPQKCDIYYGYWGSVYKAGISGTSPSGWYAEKYPYLVEFDNYAVNSEDTSNKNSMVWGRDEISWLAAQPSWYRTGFIEYLYKKISLNFENGHIALPANRGAGYYANYKSNACPNGTDEEGTYKAVLNS